MKHYLYLLLWGLLVMALPARGQNITRLEYFLDTDPGAGSATAVNITASASLTTSFSVPLPASVPSGFHFLGVRTQDANGRWSLVVMRPFLQERIAPAALPLPAITSLEYFIDTDPGFGLATAVALSPGTTVGDRSVTIPLLANLSNGYHVICVRVKDSGNQWSTVVVRPFFKENLTLANPLANLNRVEYYIDIDPGFGNGTAVGLASPATTLSNLTFTADLTGVAPGGHRLFVRARDETGRWATIGTRNFTVCTDAFAATITPQGNPAVCQGSSVVLGLPTGYGYQWYRNNALISGATSRTFAATQSSDYSAVVTNGVCSVTASPVSVVVTLTPARPTIVAPAQPICSAQPLVLQATGCTGATLWSDGSTGAGIVVAPAITTTYTATCVTNGCVGPGSAGVSVAVTTATAPPTISTSTPTVCQGTSATLTAGSCAGTVTWSTGQTGSAIVLKPTATTTYTAVCTVGNCRSAASNGLTITVTPTTANNLVLIGGNQVVCAGVGSGQFQAVGCAGSIVWSTGLSGDNLLISNPVASSIYSATCTDNGCVGPSQNTVQLTVNAIPAPPTIVFSTSAIPATLVSATALAICNGSTATLSAANCYGTLSWRSTADEYFGLTIKSSSIVATANSGLIDFYTAYCTSPDGCISSFRNSIRIDARTCDDPAVSVNRIEYFIDTDPGFGNATAPVTSPVGSARFNVPLPAGLSNGFHWLTVRVRDQNNRWSPAVVRPFLKETLPGSNTVAALNRIEYFMDTDPGFGLATAISGVSGTAISDQSFTVPLSAPLTDGFHFLTVRARDAGNRWSTVMVRPFYKETLPTSASVNIVAMEYFIDADPGFGSGSAITGFTSGTAVSRAITIGLGSVATGAHKLTIRARDTNGQWGVVGIRDFFVQDNLIITSGVPASSCRNTAFNIQFTASGNYTAGNVFTALLSDASGSFANPTTLGSVSGTASGVISATVPGGVAVGSGYQIRVVSSAPAITNSPLTTLEITALCQCLLNASLMSGNWSTPGIWSCGRVPIVTDPVRISAGHTVAVDVNNATAKSLSLWGGLYYQAGSKLRIEQ